MEIKSGSGDKEQCYSCLGHHQLEYWSHSPALVSLQEEQQDDDHGGTVCWRRRQCHPENLLQPTQQ